MDTALVIAALLLIGCALLLIFYPLWQNTSTPTAAYSVATRQTMAEVQVRYQVQLSTIKELMFDYEMGKISSEEYETLLMSTKVEAAKIRREMDLLADYNPADTEIEALVAQTRLTLTTENAHMLPSVDTEIARLNAAAPHEALKCLHCGTVVDRNHEFCGGCGHKLELDVAQATGVCHQCGHVFAANDAYCARCGILLKPEGIQPNQT